MNVKIHKTITIIDYKQLLPNCPDTEHLHLVELVFNFAGYDEIFDRVEEIEKFLDEKLVTDLAVATDLHTVLKSLWHEFRNIVGILEIAIRFRESNIEFLVNC